MKVGDLVQEWLTEQIGIVVKIGDRNAKGDGKGSIQVMWTKQGLSLFSDVHREWKDVRSLEVVSESR